MSDIRSFSLKGRLPLVTKGEILSLEAHCWSNVHNIFTPKWVPLSNAREQLASQKYDTIVCHLIGPLNLVEHSGEVVQVQLIGSLGSTYLYFIYSIHFYLQYWVFLHRLLFLITLFSLIDICNSYYSNFATSHITAECKSSHKTRILVTSH